MHLEISNVEDMVNFFVDFMKTDRLGIIEARRMILEDQMQMGTRHPDCKLAELHSTAVDFSEGTMLRPWMLY